MPYTTSTSAAVPTRFSPSAISSGNISSTPPLPQNPPNNPTTSVLEPSTSPLTTRKLSAAFFSSSILMTTFLLRSHSCLINLRTITKKRTVPHLLPTKTMPIRSMHLPTATTSPT
ncbi:hypothetical protein TGAM01_v211050 [Trichoderma gamsii]|uniref:Uncharacterized protein n=1 Tax=Trichoderma gamsii TaxID=398673 RepID=A0A2P4Z719_9HYPO|nr:hypothetical protein TGAM01_v211050 [Trichoderma gamsii]PON20069.1 hypothetical protein TGAM01_v211050 [Trichoderma gamsii]